MNSATLSLGRKDSGEESNMALVAHMDESGGKHVVDQST